MKHLSIKGRLMALTALALTGLLALAALAVGSNALAVSKQDF